VDSRMRGILRVCLKRVTDVPLHNFDCVDNKADGFKNVCWMTCSVTTQIKS